MREQIAAQLEQAFSQYGFAEPSVSKLKEACGVSLRTLYKYYPSKEEMIVAALQHRHERYLTFLVQNQASQGVEAVLEMFNQLETWMKEYAPHGCMSMNAISAFPDHPEITQAVQQHKLEVRELLGKKSLRPDLADSLFLIHEGVSNAWPVLGKQASQSAQQTIQILMEQ